MDRKNGDLDLTIPEKVVVATHSADEASAKAIRGKSLLSEFPTFRANSELKTLSKQSIIDMPLG